MDDRDQNTPKPICTCVQDPFADLPPELRPKPEQKVGGLRKVTCPGCRSGVGKRWKEAEVVSI